MSLIGIDLALLRTASLFDLAGEGRARSVTAIRELLLTLHKAFTADVVFEIGAKEATYSRRVRERLPDARIFAFEANPHIYSKFRINPELASGNVEYIHSAVSDRSGTIDFHLQVRRGTKVIKRHVGSNSLLTRLGDVETEAVKVPSVRIDDFIKRRRLSGDMTAWIDVEGAIGLVLAGMTGSLDNFLMIFCEVEEREFWAGQWTWHKVLSFMVGKGFQPVARDFEYASQYNVLFLREELLSRPEVRNALVRFYSARADVVPPAP